MYTNYTHELQYIINMFRRSSCGYSWPSSRNDTNN